MTHTYDPDAMLAPLLAARDQAITELRADWDKRIANVRISIIQNFQATIAEVPAARPSVSAPPKPVAVEAQTPKSDTESKSYKRQELADLYLASVPAGKIAEKRRSRLPVSTIAPQR